MKLLLLIFLSLTNIGQAINIVNYQFASGSELVDSFGNFALVNNGGAHFSTTSGICAYSGSYDQHAATAVSQYVYLAAGAITAMTGVNVTIDGYAYFVSGSFNSFIGGHTGGGSAYILYASGTDLRWYDGSSDQIACSACLAGSTCEHFTIQNNGLNTLIYLNGVLQSTRTLSAPWETQGMNFGNRNGDASGFLDGYISGISITASAANTFTITPTITNSPTITQSFTITPTFTQTPTITQSFTATPTVSPTFTNTPLVTYTPAPLNGLMPLPYHGFIDTTITTIEFESMIDKMVAQHWVDHGYYVLHGDAGSFQTTLDSSGHLQDPPGMNWLAVTDYAHARGVSISAYVNAGGVSCAAPNGHQTAGMYGFEKPVAESLASRHIDMAAVDLCNLPLDPAFDLHNELNLISYCLAHSGYPMTYSLWGNTFATYFPSTGANAYTETFGPVGFDGGSGIVGIFYAQLANGSFTGPMPGPWGGSLWVWDKGDALPGLTENQYRTQIDMWSMLNSPILVYLNGYSIDDITTVEKDTLLNPFVVNVVDRDPRGKACTNVAADGTTYVGVMQKGLTNSACAVAAFNESYTATTITFHMSNYTDMPSTVNVDYVHDRISTYIGPVTTSFSWTVSPASDAIFLLNANTPSPTFTPALSSTPTPTQTRTWTFSPTSTLTITRTITPTQTRTPTPPITATFTNTPTINVPCSPKACAQVYTYKTVTGQTRQYVLLTFADKTLSTSNTTFIVNEETYFRSFGITRYVLDFGTFTCSNVANLIQLKNSSRGLITIINTTNPCLNSINQQGPELYKITNPLSKAIQLIQHT